MGPRIQSVELSWRYIDTANQSLLFKLFTATETLKTFRILGPFVSYGMQMFIETMVPHLQSLTDYVWDGIGPPSDDHFNVLSRLPALRVLALKPTSFCRDQEYPEWHLPKSLVSVTHNAFAALRKLSLHNFSLSSIGSLLSSLQNSQLVEISLSNPWLPKFENYPWHLAIFLSTLAKSCSPQLFQSISIGSCDHTDDFPNPLTATQIHDIIQPILSFHKLKVIQIHLIYLFAIEDSFIDELSEAWPELERLDISSKRNFTRFPDLPPPTTTLAGLIALTRFPKLHTAYLSVDARGMKYSIIKEKFNIPTSNLKHLDLNFSLFDDPLDIVQCFPNVEDFSLWSQRDKLPHILGYTYCGVLRFAVMADLVKDLIANPIIN